MNKLPIGKANRVDAQVRAYAKRNKVTVDKAVDEMVAKKLLSYEPETFTWTYKTSTGKVVTCQHDEKYLNPQTEDKVVQKFKPFVRLATPDVLAILATPTIISGLEPPIDYVPLSRRISPTPVINSVTEEEDVTGY